MNYDVLVYKKRHIPDGVSMSSGRYMWVRDSRGISWHLIDLLYLPYFSKTEYLMKSDWSSVDNMKLTYLGICLLVTYGRWVLHRWNKDQTTLSTKPNVLPLHYCFKRVVSTCYIFLPVRDLFMHQNIYIVFVIVYIFVLRVITMCHVTC